MLELECMSLNNLYYSDVPRIKVTKRQNEYIFIIQKSK